MKWKLHIKWEKPSKVGYRMIIIMAELAAWDNFYVIIGSAAGALIGLQFLYITLFAQRKLHKGVAELGVAYATPTIVHFGMALIVSVLVCAPWKTIDIPAAILSAVGFCGVIYIGIIARRMGSGQDIYQPLLENWLFYVVLPLAAYAVLTSTLFVAPSHPDEMLYGVGAAALLLLLIGIHNAWNNVVYTALFYDLEQNEEQGLDENAGKDMPV